MRKINSYEKYKHLIGTKINEWTILDVVVRNEEKHRTYLLAQCSCGEIKEMYIGKIRNHSQQWRNLEKMSREVMNAIIKRYRIKKNSNK